MPIIRVKPGTYKRMQALAKPFKDTPNSVIGRALNALDYQTGLLPPNYPMPAIPLDVQWVGDTTNPFYGIAIRDNKGWANVVWSLDYGLEYVPRQPWQCEVCGGNHSADDCPI